MLRVSLLLVPVLGLSLGACHSDDDDDPPSLTRNLRLAVEHFQGHGPLWAMVVREFDQGLASLNGDGDLTDRVLYLWHDGDTSPTNLELAVGVLFGTSLPVLTVGDGLVAFGVDEFDQGAADRNGDGDASDIVLHVYDAADGSITNTGLAVTTTPSAIGAGHVAFRVSEGAQGFTDLNGDGATDDGVLHVYDSGTRVTTNAPRAVATESGLTFHDHAFAFATDEPSAAADLNGDGDALDDKVFELYDLTAGAVVHVPLAILAAPLAVGVDDWFVLADEAQEGSDLNGDGDPLDGVYQRVEPNLGTLLPLGLSSLRTAGSSTDGLELALVVQEIDGLDRNGDGDLEDDILVRYDAATDQALDTGLAFSFSAPMFSPTFLGDQLVAVVDEHVQGLDLNADGDEFDSVVHLVDRASGVVQNLGLGVSSAAPTAGAMLFTRREADEGEDFNADGDQDDTVTFLLRAGSTTLENTAVSDGYVQFTEDEENVLLISDESGGDLDGDGDRSDRVLLLHELATGAQQNLGLATEFGQAALNSTGGGLLLVSESFQGRDLNGDGHVGGNVAHALQVP